LANGAQAHALKVAHFENNPFARREFSQHFLNARIDFSAFEAALGIDIGTVFGDELQPINLTGFGLEGGTLLVANLAFAQMVEA
jgi:hypothetical protein